MKPSAARGSWQKSWVASESALIVFRLLDAHFVTQGLKCEREVVR